MTSGTFQHRFSFHFWAISAIIVPLNHPDILMTIVIMWEGFLFFLFVPPESDITIHSWEAPSLRACGGWWRSSFWDTTDRDISVFLHWIIDIWACQRRETKKHLKHAGRPWQRKRRPPPSCTVPQHIPHTLKPWLGYDIYIHIIWDKYLYQLIQTRHWSNKNVVRKFRKYWAVWGVCSMAFAHGDVQVAAAAFPQGQLHHGWQGDECGTRKSKKPRCAVMQHLHLHTSTRLLQDCYKMLCNMWCKDLQNLISWPRHVASPSRTPVHGGGRTETRLVRLTRWLTRWPTGWLAVSSAESFVLFILLPLES